MTSEPNDQPCPGGGSGAAESQEQAGIHPQDTHKKRGRFSQSRPQERGAGLRRLRGSWGVAVRCSASHAPPRLRQEVLGKPGRSRRSGRGSVLGELRRESNVTSGTRVVGNPAGPPGVCNRRNQSSCKSTPCAPINRVNSHLTGRRVGHYGRTDRTSDRPSWANHLIDFPHSTWCYQPGHTYQKSAPLPYPLPMRPPAERGLSPPKHAAPPKRPRFGGSPSAATRRTSGCPKTPRAPRATC